MEGLVSTSSLPRWIDVVSNLRLGGGWPCQRFHRPLQRHCLLAPHRTRRCPYHLSARPNYLHFPSTHNIASRTTCIIIEIKEEGEGAWDQRQGPHTLSIYFIQGKKGRGYAIPPRSIPLPTRPHPPLTFLLIANFTREIVKERWRGRLCLVG